MSQFAYEQAQALVEEATFDYTMGEAPAALDKLAQALDLDPQHFGAWLAKAEILIAQERFDEALHAGECALDLQPADVHAHTTLSRIWVAKGNKERAEHFIYRAKMLQAQDASS